MYKILRTLFFLFDPERIHNLIIWILSKPIFIVFFRTICRVRKEKSLQINGLNFKNRVGLAAGFDKNGEAITGLAALGFGFVEIGTVTPQPQHGNPKPRIFRLPKDKAIINRMGFNNKGVQQIKKNLKQNQNTDVILGINIGKNKWTPLEDAILDYSRAFEELYEYGDYFVINVSSPNTPDLRKLQSAQYLNGILKELQNINSQRQNKPIFVKVAPDLEFSQLDDILSIVKKNKISGIIATNTTVERKSLHSNCYVNEIGGLSGLPLRERSTEIIRYLRSKDSDITIIGVGGILSTDDAKEKLEAGADLIQIYTGLIYNGPCFVKRIVRVLEDL